MSETAEMLLARATCAAVTLASLPAGCRLTASFSLEAPPEVVLELAAKLGCEVKDRAPVGKTVWHGFTAVLHDVPVGFAYFTRGES